MAVLIRKTLDEVASRSQKKQVRPSEASEARATRQKGIGYVFSAFFLFSKIGCQHPVEGEHVGAVSPAVLRPALSLYPLRPHKSSLTQYCGYAILLGGYTLCVQVAHNALLAFETIFLQAGWQYADHPNIWGGGGWED